MKYSNGFYYMAKVIMSCKTIDQLVLYNEWIKNKGLKFEDYFQLRSLIVDMGNIIPREL